MPAHRRQDYGTTHRQGRRAWEPIVATGTVRCARADTGECKYPDPLILPGQAWQYDHINGTTLPAHKHCNLSAGAVEGNQRRRPTSRFFGR